MDPDSPQRYSTSNNKSQYWTSTIKIERVCLMIGFEDQSSLGYWHWESYVELRPALIQAEIHPPDWRRQLNANMNNWAPWYFTVSIIEWCVAFDLCMRHGFHDLRPFHLHWTSYATYDPPVWGQMPRTIGISIDDHRAHELENQEDIISNKIKGEFSNSFNDRRMMAFQSRKRRA